MEMFEVAITFGLKELEKKATAFVTTNKDLLWTKQIDDLGKTKAIVLDKYFCSHGTVLNADLWVIN